MADHVQPYFGKQALSTQESSHDTLNQDNFKQWLSNYAGIGVYAHGRVHQEVGYSIFVGDLIHKRGHLVSDDLLLMEEQNLLSMGEPLSTNSRLGELRALAVLPAMSTSNGEGTLVAYYQFGIVSFDTNEVPRESRYDGEGNQIQKGWDSKQLVNHLLNSLGAVGRYAVAVLTRDHLFRSVRGLHFLKVTLGEGTFNSENVNKISMDVEPLLALDVDLSGAAVGFWLFGNRMFATTGLLADKKFSSSSFGRGFVSWNQATTFTEDRTPVSLWEGLWTVDHQIKAIHKFVEFDEDASKNSFGFVCSDASTAILGARIDSDLEHDIRGGKIIPIEWSFDTARFALTGLNTKSSVNDCVIELVASASSQKIRVFSRTDSCEKWLLWSEFSPADKLKAPADKILLTESLGKPHVLHREATWVQLRVEGIGFAEIRLLELDFSAATVKAGRSAAVAVSTSKEDYFAINSSPTEERW